MQHHHSCLCYVGDYVVVLHCICGSKEVIKSFGLVGREDYSDRCGCTDREANKVSEIGWNSLQ
jgi:hypothetical protein